MNKFLKKVLTSFMALLILISCSATGLMNLPVIPYIGDSDKAEASTVMRGYFTSSSSSSGHCITHSTGGYGYDNANSCINMGGQWVSGTTEVSRINFTLNGDTLILDDPEVAGVLFGQKPKVVSGTSFRCGPNSHSGSIGTHEYDFVKSTTFGSAYPYGNGDCQTWTAATNKWSAIDPNYLYVFHNSTPTLVKNNVDAFKNLPDYSPVTLINKSGWSSPTVLYWTEGNKLPSGSKKGELRTTSKTSGSCITHSTGGYGYDNASSCINMGGQWVPGTSYTKTINFTVTPTELRTDTAGVGGIMFGQTTSTFGGNYWSCGGFSGTVGTEYRIASISNFNSVFNQTSSVCETRTYAGVRTPITGNYLGFYHLAQHTIAKIDHAAFMAVPDYTKVSLVSNDNNQGQYTLYWSNGGASATELVCPAGTTKKGTGETAFCEKIVDKMNNVNVNIGDITNNLTNGNFASGTNHNSSLVINGGNGNSNQTVNGLTGKDANFVNITNLPSDGKVTSLTNIWSPEFIVTYKGKMLKAPKPSDATQLQQYDKALSEFKSQAGTDINAHSSVEVVSYKVESIAELEALTKDKASLLSIFNKDSSQKYIADAKIKYAHLNKEGLINYENLKLNQEGLYLIATKFVDQTKTGSLADKTTYTFKPIELNFLNTLGYLPLSNYIVGQVNDMYMSVGLKKKDHGLTNLKYSNDNTTYESMKVPSAHNYTTGHSLIGSTNGGLNLLDKDLNKVAIAGGGASVSSLKVNDITEKGSGFLIACDTGVFYLDNATKTIKPTSITTKILDIEVVNDVLISLSEDALAMYFIVGDDLLPSVTKHDLTGLFSSNKKPGKFEMLGDVVSVSTVDEGVDSEVIFLTTK